MIKQKPKAKNEKEEESRYNCKGRKSYRAWENSRHFPTPPLVSLRNNVWEMSAEIPYWWRVTTQIWLFLIGHSCVGNWFQQSYQCLISVLVSQTSFRGKTCGSVMKFRPFFNFLFFRQKGHTHQKHSWISSFIQAASMCGTTKQLTRAINPNARKQVPITLKYQWKGQSGKGKWETCSRKFLANNTGWKTPLLTLSIIYAKWTIQKTNLKGLLDWPLMTGIYRESFSNHDDDDNDNVTKYSKNPRIRT